MVLQSRGVGKGTTFRWYIRVPALPDSIPHIPAPQLAPPPAIPGRSSLDEKAKPPPPPIPELSAFTEVTVPASVVPAVKENESAVSRMTRPLWSEPESDGAVTLAGKKVLVVEPCSLVREVIQRALRQWGCSVCAVATEFEAISKLRLKTILKPNQTSASQQALRKLVGAPAAAVAFGSPPKASASSNQTSIGPTGHIGLRVQQQTEPPQSQQQREEATAAAQQAYGALDPNAVVQGEEVDEVDHLRLQHADVVGGISVPFEAIPNVSCFVVFLRAFSS